MIPDFRPFLKQNTKKGKGKEEKNKLQIEEILKPLSNLPRRFSKNLNTKIKEDFDDYLNTDPTKIPATKKALTLTRRPRTRELVTRKPKRQKNLKRGKPNIDDENSPTKKLVETSTEKEQKK